MSNTTALTNYLKVLEPFFQMENVNEICINRPGELWVEQACLFKRYTASALTMDFLQRFALLVGEYNAREISPEYPTLSSILPDGSRIQFAIEPACAKGSFICSIRRKAVMQISIEHYFSQEVTMMEQEKGDCYLANADNIKLLEHYKKQKYTDFLAMAVQFKKNILISGGTSTGKTTLLNSLLHYISPEERIITIETDREVVLPHPNTVHLLASEEGKAVANITMLDLLKTSLRLRPDRILVSEIRAEEALPYLRAINSGHPGSISTLHADSTEHCFEQLAFMAMQSGTSLSRKEIVDYAKSIVDVVVQIKRGKTGRRYIEEIYYKEH